jgi:hypothetical protein
MELFHIYDEQEQPHLPRYQRWEAISAKVQYEGERRLAWRETPLPAALAGEAPSPISPPSPERAPPPPRRSRERRGASGGRVVRRE